MYRFFSVCPFLFTQHRCAERITHLCQTFYEIDLTLLRLFMKIDLTLLRVSSYSHITSYSGNTKHIKLCEHAYPDMTYLCKNFLKGVIIEMTAMV